MDIAHGLHLFYTNFAADLVVSKRRDILSTVSGGANIRK
jgi:hypothetical protein